MDYKKDIGAIDLGSGKLSARPRSNSKRGARTLAMRKS
jgi:hypothetical protein